MLQGCTGFERTFWAFGVAMCDLLGLPFFRLRVSPSAAESKISRDLLRKLSPFRPAARGGPYPWPPAVLRSVGSTGVDFLDAVLSWEPLDRSCVLDCISHSWLGPQGELVGHGGSFPPPLSTLAGGTSGQCCRG